MRRRTLFVLLAGAGCRSAPPGATFGRQLLSAAGADEPLAPERADRALRELSQLADEARRELEHSPGRSLATTVSELLFGRWGFVREVTSTSLDYVLLPSVLERRRGNCVGLGTLFLALADALVSPSTGTPTVPVGPLSRAAHGVLAPGHFYVRTEEAGATRNVELLRAGEVMPDSWYRARYPIPGEPAREYSRPLTRQEVIGVVHYDVGNELRRVRALPRSRAALQRAVDAFPDFSEAHASLGAVQHLLGELDAAAKSYELARAANPHLPGIDQNEALLAAERHSR